MVDAAKGLVLGSVSGKSDMLLEQEAKYGGCVTLEVGSSYVT